MKLLLRALQCLRPYPHLASYSVVVTILSSLAGLLAPWPLKILIDSVLQDYPLPPLLVPILGPFSNDRVVLLTAIVVAGLGVALLENGLSVLNEYANTKLAQRMTLDFRSRMFLHAQRLSLAFHDQRRAGGLIYAVNYQAGAIPGVVMSIQPMVQSALTLIGMFWISLQINTQLALLAMMVVPFLYYAVGYYATHIQPQLRQVKGMESETLSIVHEALSMLRVIVAFGREDYEHRRFHAQGERALDARVKLTVRQTLFSLVVNVTTAAGTALVLGFGAYQTLQGKLTVGQLLVVMAYIASVYKPLEAISYAIGHLQDQLVSLQFAFDLLDKEPEIKDLPGATTIERAKGRITFENVQFSYTRRVDTLKDVSFEAEAGRVIALVGPTGAGKTTLASLIPRFYDPQQGRILLDEIDIRQLTLRSLREQVSIVLQEPLLFSGSIADNIRYGRLDAHMNEITEAAKAANAHDFIMRLPNKYDTPVGERGVQLSGGERQRICIARAFLKDAPILILDEPTSSIDSKTESVILQALERLMLGRTTLMIAHRLSTIRNADLILVMNNGQIAECGSHEDLLRQSGLYRQLYDMQIGQTRRKPESDLVAVPAGPSAPSGRGSGGVPQNSPSPGPSVHVATSLGPDGSRPSSEEKP